MAQFDAHSHPARNFLLDTGKKTPGLWASFDALRTERVYPPHIYVTDVDAFRAILRAISAAHGPDAVDQIREHFSSQELLEKFAARTTLAAWRMTQGIYRIDPALYEALITTELSGDLPADVLLRLPEWCVYVETPGLLHTHPASRETLNIMGAWARIDVSPEGQLTLVVGIAAGTGPLPQTRHYHIPLIGSLTDALRSVHDSWSRETGDGRSAADDVPRIASYLTPIINCLLYLCAGQDISGKHGQPGNPQPKRTRRDGWRLFPADGTRVWDVGVRIGAALRRAYQAEQLAGAGGTGEDRSGPRPHVRRAHWHGFRSGPRKRPDGSDIPAAERRFDLRWLPPIPVNLDDADQLPSVVRPVK